MPPLESPGWFTAGEDCDCGCNHQKTCTCGCGYSTFKEELHAKLDACAEVLDPKVTSVKLAREDWDKHFEQWDDHDSFLSRNEPR